MNFDPSIMDRMLARMDRSQKEVPEKTKERRFLMAEWMEGHGIHSLGIENFVEEGRLGNIHAVENQLLQEVLVQGGLRMFTKFVEEFDLTVQVMAKLNY